MGYLFWDFARGCNGDTKVEYGSEWVIELCWNCCKWVLQVTLAIGIKETIPP